MKPAPTVCIQDHLYREDLSTKTNAGKPICLIRETVPLYKEHLSTKDIVGWSIYHFRETTTSLSKDHLSTEATICLPLEWSLWTGLTNSHTEGVYSRAQCNHETLNFANCFISEGTQNIESVKFPGSTSS